MLDIKYIREHADKVRQNCKNRLAKVDIDRLLDLDEKRRKLETKIGECRSRRNTVSKTKPTMSEIAAMKKLGEDIKISEKKLAAINCEFREILLTVPNLTHPEVKISRNEDDNRVLDTYLEPTRFDFKPLDHVELALRNDLIDFDRAAKITGAKFYYLKNELAMLEFALIQYALSTAIKNGFTPFVTPDLAKQTVLEGLGFNPRGESTQVYNVANTDLSLVGTAEITMGGYHQDEVLNEYDLPKKYVAVSHCFRTEAGSYSKYAKGIFRVHQFTKVEMFIYSRPDDSENAHQLILAVEREIFSGLGIPYRIVDHCTADLGSPSYRTFDLEAWLPGKPNKNGEQGDWAEMTSTSNCTDYQARGLNIKYRDQEDKKHYLHMLNGTAIAVARTIIAIMENGQRSDGSIAIPKVLRDFMASDGKISAIRMK
ncbi:MAG: serine--tRNA ligase [Planctomycetes bacterium]|jgi:seryl-tRNA synthetase|nr:serine--tRNA ligase [Planctomycetota bacterium]